MVDLEYLNTDISPPICGLHEDYDLLEALQWWAHLIDWAFHTGGDFWDFQGYIDEFVNNCAKLNCLSNEDTAVLTHWGRVTHVCFAKLTIIGSDNGLWSGHYLN